GLTGPQRAALLGTVARNVAVQRQGRSLRRAAAVDGCSDRTRHGGGGAGGDDADDDDDEDGWWYAAGAAAEDDLEFDVADPLLAGGDAAAVAGTTVSCRQSRVAGDSASRRRVLSARSKYSRLFERKAGVDRSDHNVSDATRGLAEMRRVTASLSNWARDTLEAPTVLRDPLDPTGATQRREERPGALPDNGEATAAAASVPSALLAPPPATAQPPSGGRTSAAPPPLTQAPPDSFEILLTSCKPSILETQPPARLHVAQEANPPAALLQSLRDSLKVVVRVPALERAKRMLETQQQQMQPSSADANRVKHPSRRAAYGVWYVHPEKWADNMAAKTHAGDAEKTSSKRRPKASLVQQKLDAIAASRASEEAALQLQLLQLLPPSPTPQPPQPPLPPPSSAPASADPAQQQQQLCAPSPRTGTTSRRRSSTIRPSLGYGAGNDGPDASRRTSAEPREGGATPIRTGSAVPIGAPTAARPAQQPFAVPKALKDSRRAQAAVAE
ncbi:hypothetical protein HK405_011699, partial [Cladochytrium tenue]